MLDKKKDGKWAYEDIKCEIPLRRRRMTKSETRRIPKYDCLGNKLNIGDKAILFSDRGIHYEGTIQWIGNKRWFVVDEVTRIGGIGTCKIKKVEQ